jgi:hypothetical protein
MSIDQVIRSITPSEPLRRVLTEGYARGALWAGILTSAAILPVFLLTLSSQLTFDEFARSVVISAISAAGGLITLASDSGLGVTGEIFAEIGLRPTLITLLIGFLAYRAGGKVKELRGGEISLKTLSSLSALGLGAGFASVLFAMSFFAQGSINAFSAVSLEPIGLLGIIWIFSVVALPAWLGSMKYLGRKSTSSWKWAYASVRNFAGLYGALIVLAALVFFLSQWISPDWGMSSPKLPDPQGGEFGWSEAGQLGLAIASFLVVLPAILFTILSVGMGANFALQFGALGSEILGSLDSVLPGIDLSAISNFSVSSTFGPWPFVSVIVALVLTSLIAGAKASGKFGSTNGFRRDFLVVGVVALLVGLIARSLSSVDVAWSNLGKPPHQAKDGELLLQEGFVNLGVTAVSLSLILVAVAVFLALGATQARQFLSEAFPRIYSGSFTPSSSEPRGLLAQILGAATSAVIVAAIVIPISAASVERVWAGVDGPERHFDDIVKVIEGEDLNATKELFGFKKSEADAWLPDSVLEGALPEREQRIPISASNFNDDPWKTGNLDAKTTVTWELEDGKVELPLVSQAELIEHLPLVRHPKFSSTLGPVEIRFSTGPALQAAGKNTVNVNGKDIVRGTYKALPGSYELVVPGFKLVAPTTQTFYTTGEDLKFIAEEVISLTPQQEAVMAKGFADLALECAEPNDVTQLRCFDFSEIYTFRTTESGFSSDEYFGLQSSNFDIVSSLCEGSVSDEVIAADVAFRTADCTATVKFDVEYFDSKLEERPVFQTQRYDGCPQISWAYCERFRQVRVGTNQVEVRGKSLGEAKLVSEIPFELSLFGVLDARGEFTARESWIAPPPSAVPTPKPEKMEPIELLGRYETKQDMVAANPNPRLGDGYIVGSGLVLWVWDGRAWLEIGSR